MKAAVYHEYGSPEVIRIEDIEKPTPKDHQVLVRVRASTVGTWDCEARSFSFPLWFWLPLRLAMGIRKPRWRVRGGPVHLHVGAPIPTADLTIEDRDALRDKVRALIGAQLQAFGAPPSVAPE